MADVLRTHFFDSDEDRLLEHRNIHFWRALAGHVQADSAIDVGATILDFGSHQGGLLALMAERFKPSRLIGIETLTSARDIAKQRLMRYDVAVNLYGRKGWSQVEDNSADLVLSHEVLQYSPDLGAIFAQVRRVLKPQGFAYVVLGCHTENPIWHTWKSSLEDIGHQVHDHTPLDIMSAGAEYGLSPSIRPLRDNGWIHHDPTSDSAFSFPSAGLLLDHQYRHKLLFRFELIA